jgi:crotonobetainyl-CoA:carnitine CoA-transferase CaiB-like acyl-CoA transferase
MRPLAGIRVIDLTRVLSGPYCTMALADLGADVIKVEPPGGDDTRQWGPPYVAGESAYFLSANRGKRGIVLDLKAEAGRQALWDLIATADIVAQNFRPGTLEKLGFGWEAIHAKHPRVILVSLSGYGQTGPLASRPGYDLVAQGEGGLMGVTGEPGGPPVKAGFSIADIGAGMWATIGLLAALRVRDATGEGGHVDVSLLDTMVSWQTYQGQGYLLAGKVPRALGSAHPSIVPYQAFEASDGYFTVAVGNDSLWLRLCDVLDRAGGADAAGERDGAPWYRAGQYTTNDDRVRQREEIVGALNALFRTRPRAEWLALLDEAGIPAGSVATVDEVFANPQVRARGMVREVEHPAIGRVPMAGVPVHLDSAELGTDKAPPLLGEDTAAVLRELGYDEERIAAVLRGRDGA